MQNRKQNPLSIGAGFQKMAQAQTDKKMIERYLDLDILCQCIEPDAPEAAEHAALCGKLNKRWMDGEFKKLFQEMRDARKNTNKQDS